MGQPKVGSPISFNTDSPLAVAGICLAIGANLIISAGLNGQKWVHNQNERLPEAERQPYTKQSLWWLGLIGTVLGEVLNFLAFGFAGAAIVTPLGAVCVVANEVIACAFLGEQFRVRDLFGVTCTVAGSVLVVIAAPVTERDMAVGDFVRLASGAVFLSYMVCVLLALVAIWRLLPKVQHKHPAWGLTLCSLLGTLTVLSATALSNFVRLTASGRSQFGSVVPYVLLLVMVPSAIGQVRYLNETMERFDNTTVVPVYYILFTLSTVTGSAMLYQDFYDQPMANVLLFLLGCALCFCGVGLLTTGRGGGAHGEGAHHAAGPRAGGHMQLGAVEDVEIAGGRAADGDDDESRALYAARGAQRTRTGGGPVDVGIGLGGVTHALSISRRASLDGIHAVAHSGMHKPTSPLARPTAAAPWSGSQHATHAAAPASPATPPYAAVGAPPGKGGGGGLPALPPTPRCLPGVDASPLGNGAWAGSGGRDLASSDDDEPREQRGGANVGGGNGRAHSGSGAQPWE